MVVRGVPDRNGSYIPGVTCNKIYLDLGLPLSIRVVRSEYGVGSAAVNDYFLGSRTATIPCMPSWTGVAFVTQAAFTDTANGSLRISQAAETIVPAHAARTIRRGTVWDLVATGTASCYTNLGDTGIPMRLLQA